MLPESINKSFKPLPCIMKWQQAHGTPTTWHRDAVSNITNYINVIYNIFIQPLSQPADATMPITHSNKE